MFIFYKMEYVIAYKMLLKESIDEKKEPFLGMSLALRREHAILLIFMSLCLASMTQHHFVWDVFCNANVKYTSTFQCCYEQRLLFLSFPGHTRHRQHGLARHRHTQVQSTLTGYFMRSVLLVKGWTHCCLRNCFNSSWRTFIKVLETFLGRFGPSRHHGITPLVHPRCKPPLHPMGPLLDWDLVPVETTGVQWSHCRVPDIS